VRVLIHVSNKEYDTNGLPTFVLLHTSAYNIREVLIGVCIYFQKYENSRPR
jgi:hypothetical protein